MAFWKQLLIAIVLVAAGLAGWVWVAPGAGDKLVSWGVPQGLVTAIAPTKTAENKTGGQGQGNQGGGNRNGGGNGPQATLIAMKAVTTGVVNDRLSAIGDGKAVQSVQVMPQAAGTITEILVKSGQQVKKGDVIARLDDDEQIIMRDQAEVSLRSARETSAAYANLKSYSRLEVFNAQNALETAQLNLTNAELSLKRRAIVAPFDGTVGIVAVNVGDNATTSTAIVSLDDRSELLVDFWAPERFTTAVKSGMPVQASSVARPGQVFEGSVEAIDARIDEASRTIRVRARIPNVDDSLRAGMSFGVSMRFAGETYPSVDPLSVQWDSAGSFVWQIVDNKSVKTRVRIIQRNQDYVLVEAGLKEGDQVAIEGLQRVREGGAVRVAGQSSPEVASR